MEDSMFDEEIVTTAEEINEAREALIKLGVEITRRRRDTEFNEAQIVFANANTRMELAPPGDDEANKSAEAANWPACVVQEGLDEERQSAVPLLP